MRANQSELLQIKEEKKKNFRLRKQNNHDFISCIDLEFIDIKNQILNCSNRKQHGELFFDELDYILKNNRVFQEAIISKCTHPIISTGEFAEKLKENGFSVTIMTPGNLRGSKKLNLDNYSDIIKGNTFSFVDDSYYKGRTLRKIFNEINRLGGRIIEVNVIYNDGNDPFVNSLFNKEYFDKNLK